MDKKTMQLLFNHYTSEHTARFLSKFMRKKTFTTMNCTSFSSILTGNKTSASIFHCISPHRHINPTKRATIQATYSRNSNNNGRGSIQIPNNPPPPGTELYQPFRKPAQAKDAAKQLELDEQLRLLRDRIGLWHEYAQLIPGLTRFGFTPSSIEEATGISGVEQNKIFVASNVRSSLIASGFDESYLPFFDSGGADILYELRTLSAQQRKTAAEYAVEHAIDGREARELAKAMKDFDRRKKSGRDCFSRDSPGDCLAYAYYCQSMEYRNEADVKTALEKALSYAETEKAKSRILGDLEEDTESKEEEARAVVEAFKRLPVVRLMEKEVESSRVPLVVPVANPVLQEFVDSPGCKLVGEGGFRIFHSDKGWKSWVVLPGWQPLLDAEKPVVIAFPDANVLPWKGRTADGKEPILVVVDKARTSVHPFSFSLFECDEGLGLKRGAEVASDGGDVRSLGLAVLVVRPPRQENEDSPESIDWE